MLPVKPSVVVVKLGTGLLTSGGDHINSARIKEISAQIHSLRQEGTKVIIVSSGAIGLGVGRLGLQRRPRSLPRLQSCAAIGQGILWKIWQDALGEWGITVGQLLLTREDLRSRHRHLAAKATFDCLLKDGVVPLVNENDSVSADEIKFGDNDILSAMVASLVHADLLFVLSTAPGLIDRTGTGEVIPVVEKITPAVEKLAGGTENPLATGGMITKIGAAKLAMRSGTGMYLTSGERDQAILSALRGEGTGTFFTPHGLPLAAKKRWLAFFEKPQGNLQVDRGATLALQEKGSSLLPIGVRAVRGDFGRGSVVELWEEGGDVPFARGLACFTSREMKEMAGKTTAELRSLRPTRKRWELVHRDTLALLP